MLKVGIQGASSKNAGELIRVLLNHPDVEVCTVCDSEFSGLRVSSVHHGLIGEQQLTFVDKFSENDLDVVFLCKADNDYDEIINNQSLDSEVRILDMTGLHRLDYDNFNMVYGLPEMNRKPLVRGAKRAVVPSSLSSIILVSLLPLAANALLKDDLNISVYIADIERFNQDSLDLITQEISNQLTLLQPSFNAKVRLALNEKDYSRGVRISMSLDCGVSLDDVLNLYETRYEDHNLTYIVNEPVSIKEVEGSDKCLISVDKTADGLLTIDAVADSYLRGGAGDAIHVMNLLCGLLERTGLSLKVNAF